MLVALVYTVIKNVIPIVSVMNFLNYVLYQLWTTQFNEIKLLDQMINIWQNHCHLTTVFLLITRVLISVISYVKLVSFRQCYTSQTNDFFRGTCLSS
ncbi:hypothetical protein AB4K20DRAFT_1341656 [Rhizopus microsporus]